MNNDGFLSRVSGRWSLRITAQIFPILYSRWGYTCMQMIDCEVPATAAERRWVHLVLALMVALGVEILIAFSKLLDDPRAAPVEPRACPPSTAAADADATAADPPRHVEPAQGDDLA